MSKKRKQWIVEEEEKFDQLTKDLQSVKKLMKQVSNPGLELYGMFSVKEAEIANARDQQFMKLLRIYHENPKLHMTDRCMAFLRSFPKRKVNTDFLHKFKRKTIQVGYEITRKG